MRVWYRYNNVTFTKNHAFTLHQKGRQKYEQITSRETVYTN